MLKRHRPFLTSAERRAKRPYARRRRKNCGTGMKNDGTAVKSNIETGFTRRIQNANVTYALFARRITRKSADSTQGELGQWEYKRECDFVFLCTQKKKKERSRGEFNQTSKMMGKLKHISHHQNLRTSTYSNVLCVTNHIPIFKEDRIQK